MHEVLTEVLHEPCAPHDRHIGAGVQEHLLSPLRLLFAPPGEEHQLLDVTVEGGIGQRSHRFWGAGNGEVRVVRDVGCPHALEYWAPGGGVLPIEWGTASA